VPGVAFMQRQPQAAHASVVAARDDRIVRADCTGHDRRSVEHDVRQLA